MDNRQLLYFKTVCDEGGFTKAAEKLYISPQGINKAIHRLEDELGGSTVREHAHGTHADGIRSGPQKPDWALPRSAQPHHGYD